MSEWFKEHDWKSCVRLKRTGGSNPLLCAKRNTPSEGVFFAWRREEIEKGSEVLGGSREERGGAKESFLRKLYHATTLWQQCCQNALPLIIQCKLNTL